MPNNRQSWKRLRQAKKQNLRNRQIKSEIKTYTKKLVEAVESDEVTEAETLLRESYEIRAGGAYPAGHWLIANAQSALGECLLELGRHDEAEPLLRDAWVSLRDALEPTNPRRREARDRLVRLLQRTGRAEQATTLAP